MKGFINRKPQNVFSYAAKQQFIGSPMSSAYGANVGYAFNGSKLQGSDLILNFVLLILKSKVYSLERMALFILSVT